MRIWDEILRPELDRAMVVGLGFTNSDTNQEDAAQATLLAAVELGYQTTVVPDDAVDLPELRLPGRRSGNRARSLARRQLPGHHHSRDQRWYAEPRERPS